MSERLANAFSRAKAEQRACFIAYLCAGDPDFDTSLEACRAVIRGGADILELGVPFSDPLADGLTNQLAAQRALDSGMTQEKVFALVERLREESDIPIIFYTYYNLVFSIGEAAYAERAAKAGVDGLLTLDLPPEEAGTLLEACLAKGLANILIMAPTTPPERIKLIGETATGFIYYVSRTGVTGERSEMAAGLAEQVQQVRKGTPLPLAVGFGVSRPEHVREVAAVADGVVVGSAIVNCIPQHLGDATATAQAIEAKVRHLCEGLSG